MVPSPKKPVVPSCPKRVPFWDTALAAPPRQFPPLVLRCTTAVSPAGMLARAITEREGDGLRLPHEIALVGSGYHFERP